MNQIDYIFETSWETCNLVGGIYTVLSTKAPTIVKQYKNNYICIGPDIPKDHQPNADFVEDKMLYKNWRETAAAEGLKIRVGHWRQAGNAVSVLVDFTPYFEKKNTIFTEFWLQYRLDSIEGQWDYIEPALFGYAAAKVIESFYNFYCTAQDRIVAQFHEWMTGTGILYIKSHLPQIATAFTTHATVLGRSIAGSGLPLYSQLCDFDAQEYAQQLGVLSKQSLESISAQQADVLTTVSDITNQECASFLHKKADVITINGFDNSFVPIGAAYEHKREIARQKLRAVAMALTQQDISKEALYVLNSGRYEFTNKGIDLFIKSLAMLQGDTAGREVVAFITVPAASSGQRTDLIERLNEAIGEPKTNDFLTHPLHNPENDPILCALHQNNIENSPQSKIKVIFAPIYLNGHDGIFNLPYYDLQIGFDLCVFPSYYEPWGYTPLESVAFGIPAITTTLAGFGVWAQTNFDKNMGVWSIERRDDNASEVVKNMAEVIRFFMTCSPSEWQQQREAAVRISQHAAWANLFNNYLIAYDIALEKSALRYEQYKFKTSQIGSLVNKITPLQPHWKHLTIKSNLTQSLKPLDRISKNLWWSWNYEARELFEEIGGDLWKQCEENPVALLQLLSLETIKQFSQNEEFISKTNRVFKQFQNYLSTPRIRPEKEVAYFSMEFGISNELKIFSGGLGMLAGDYLKEASDANVNLLGVGLLYRCGYFTQQIAHGGEQLNIYTAQSFSKLPIAPMRNEAGDFLKISIALPGRNLYARIWRVEVGRVSLYLLDTDFAENLPEDRQITYNLYGGDNENRLKQELLLGIGGIRMLELLGKTPTLYHLNEGHAAFLSLERLRLIMQQRHLCLSAATELVRTSSLFTTHTPVPAGHDAFSEDLMRTYFAHYAEQCAIPWAEFMTFGRKNSDSINDKFSMSVLACKFSQEINGVSRIHGRVSREMFADLYDGFFPQELHIGYVTNGVHYPTWAHKKWQQLHSQVMGADWQYDSSNPKHWEKLKNVEDDKIWNLKEELRAELLEEVRLLLSQQMRIRNESPSLIVNTVKSINNKALTIGFARRFATYKRAHLLFASEERLHTLLNNPEHPIQFIFAGKAHPHDKAGQDLIKRIVELSRKPQFVGKIIFLENYDIILAKKLISGCDVWLNTPTRPLEASGTSGEKAIMNGVLNFSVLDGWWAEGYQEGAGWAMSEFNSFSNPALQDELDASILYDTIENKIVPTFYTREKNIPVQWVTMMKANFALISPHFTMKRQLDDYYHQFYHQLEKRAEKIEEREILMDLLRWKMKVITAWDAVAVTEVNYPDTTDDIYFLGDPLKIAIKVNLGELLPEDVKIECVVVTRNGEKKEFYAKYPFQYVENNQDEAIFCCHLHAEDAGIWNCAIRVIPQHPLLPHDLDFNLVKWG
ncbi:MAG: alpha-glucan family phosphorylase [Bacteroidales bacterium]|jgi:phosphorylase/glycogen(starch) synthase|nr:alpha-glucan family phosphorylase [Bacteroidales bacterium]